MKHWVYFTIAMIAALAVFLRVWANAPEHEKRQRLAEELELVATHYTSARREAFTILRVSGSEIGGIDAYLAARPRDLVERTGADVTLRAVGAGILYGRGRDDAARALAQRVSETFPPLTAARAQQMPIVRRVAMARVLAETGRADEARIASEITQAWIDARQTDQIAREENISVLTDQGWVWKTLGEDDLARAHWQRLYDYHKGQTTHPYNMACFAALAGDRERALSYLDDAVDQYRPDAQRDLFSLDELMDNDPDLDPIRDEPAFIATRRLLAAKNAEYDAFLERANVTNSGPDEPEPSTSSAPTPSDPVP
ncbi:MAG: hypothetical protein R3B46_08580 [Phycisphaerales bacterium]